MTMNNLNDVIANELVRRVRKLSTEELLALAKNGAAGKRRASRSGTHKLELPRRVAEGDKPLTIAEAIMKTTGTSRKALSTAEIVAGTIALRQDAQEATIRAEISKLTSGGLLLRHGPRVGGAYTAATASLKAANG